MEKHITVGIAGHVDHGKTSLVKALTGIETDRMAEEKRRRFSIEAGIAPMQVTSGLTVALVDVPGHTEFLKNTIRGLSSVDAAVLIVAADDGVMPQTREHVEILRFFGARGGFVVLSKTDLVDKETLELAELEVREMLQGSFLENSPVIPFSVLDNRGLTEVRAQMEKLVTAVNSKHVQPPFRLWVDQVKTFPGHGTVVSGTVLSGRLRKGDAVQIMPTGLETRARSLQSHHDDVAQALAGQRVGVNLHKIAVRDLRRGMTLVEPGSVGSSFLLNVDLHVLPSAGKPVKNRQRVKLYLGTSITNTLVILMGREQLAPGESGLAQLRLMKPVAALGKDPFVICPLNVQRTIAGGRILEVPGQKYRKGNAAPTLSRLEALRRCDLRGYLRQVVQCNPNRLVKAGELAPCTGFALSAIKAIARELTAKGEIVAFEDRGFFDRPRYQELKAAIGEAVAGILLKDPIKGNVKADEIRYVVAPLLDEVPFQQMIAELCSEGRLIRTSGGFKAPNVSGPLSEKAAGLTGLLLEFAVESRLVPFSADTFWKRHHKQDNKKEIQRLMDHLAAEGRLVRLNNRRFMSRQAMEEIKTRVIATIQRRGALSIEDCREVLGYGRSVGIPVFEYLDSIGFTRREGDRRILL